MCGIVGYITKQAVGIDSSLLTESLNLMNHRGPDDRGFVLIGGDQLQYLDQALLLSGSFSSKQKHSIALGHVRFSIVDLTSAGHQPFVTDDGKVCLTFNGELYNYIEVRQILEQLGHTFITNTDTEVLAKAYQQWGVECFKRFNGFWALALYDFERRELLLSRDRIGKAPLYYCQTKSGLFWSSELKVLLEHVPEERMNINSQSVAHFANWLKKDFDDSTFYSNIKTFPKASYAWIKEDGSFNPSRYWELPSVRYSEFDLSIPDAVDQFNATMSESVRIRHRADAPVAVQLSGGMDSSTLVAKAAAISDEVDTYTIKYGYGAQDEEPFARSVAERYRNQVKYHVVRPSTDDFIDKLGVYTSLMDEPYHSPNQLSNQHIWHQMADHGLRAVLYGAGGDEVFAGYASEYYPPYLNSLLKKGQVGRFFKEFFSCTEYKQGLSIKDYAVMAAKLIPKMPRQSTYGRIKFIPKEINPLSRELVDFSQRRPPHDIDERLLGNMENWRMNYWLRIDNQNSMGVPIELRSPFLDHNLIEYAFKLPHSYLIRNGWMKWIVRHSMKADLPSNVVWRREKMGFPFPLKDWLLKNRSKLIEEFCGFDCRYVDSAKLSKHYVKLCDVDAEYTWGMISILFWWKYCVLRLG